MKVRYTKAQALALFGGSARMAKELNVTPQAVRALPDILPQRKSDEVLGWLVRTACSNPETIKVEVEK